MERRKFSAEFKLEAVRPIKDRGVCVVYGVILPLKASHAGCTGSSD